LRNLNRSDFSQFSSNNLTIRRDWLLINRVQPHTRRCSGTAAKIDYDLIAFDGDDLPLQWVIAHYLIENITCTLVGYRENPVGAVEGLGKINLQFGRFRINHLQIDGILVFANSGNVTCSEQARDENLPDPEPRCRIGKVSHTE